MRIFCDSVSHSDVLNRTTAGFRRTWQSGEKVSRVAHNHETARSNRASATMRDKRHQLSFPVFTLKRRYLQRYSGIVVLWRIFICYASLHPKAAITPMVGVTGLYPVSSGFESLLPYQIHGKRKPSYMDIAHKGCFNRRLFVF